MPHGGKHKTITPKHGSDMYGGGANINQSTPAFAKSKRYSDAVDFWETKQGDGSAK